MDSCQLENAQEKISVLQEIVTKNIQDEVIRGKKQTGIVHSMGFEKCIMAHVHRGRPARTPPGTPASSLT